MWEGMVACLSVIALHHTGDLYPASCCMIAGIHSDNPDRDEQERIDGRTYQKMSFYGLGSKLICMLFFNSLIPVATLLVCHIWECI